MADQSHHRAPATAARAFQFHPARPAIIDLFNLYLGRSGREKADDLVREPPVEGILSIDGSMFVPRGSKWVGEIGVGGLIVVANLAHWLCEKFVCLV